MSHPTLSKQTVRRFVLGRQGLWPGRRWQGKDGVTGAIRQMEAVQLDPLNVVARSQDIALYGRVLDYRPELLDTVTYTERQFFDYGGALFLYPMEELPYWQVHMRSRASSGYWANYLQENAELVASMHALLRERGPLGNRELEGNGRIHGHYRGRKDTALALYALWITGEAMVHHRNRFERVYALREDVAPSGLLREVDTEEALDYFGRKAAAFYGLIRATGWRNEVSEAVRQKLTPAEAAQRLAALVEAGVLAEVKVEGEREPRYLLASDLPDVEAIAAGGVPAAWQPLETTTDEESVFLAPLEIVSARGRAAKLFDFEYVWEVYKPAHQRRWGYYTLPILWGDRLVARVDPRLDRKTGRLHINGLWLEDEGLGQDDAFAAALARGMARFRAFAGAEQVEAESVAWPLLRSALSGD